MPPEHFLLSENESEGQRTDALPRGKNSFAARFRAGWTKEQLMRHYALTEAQYERVVMCLVKMRTILPRNAEQEGEK